MGRSGGKTMYVLTQDNPGNMIAVSAELENLVGAARVAYLRFLTKEYGVPSCVPEEEKNLFEVRWEEDPEKSIYELSLVRILFLTFIGASPTRKTATGLVEPFKVFDVPSI